ncbi:MAG: glycoside hydrolase family 92 protein, partial [Bacteroidaceae bacterium]
MFKRTSFLTLLVLFCASLQAQTSNPACNPSLTRYVNPFLGTATLWEPEDLGYTHTETKRAWGAETYPGATLPNAMVQATPVTMYHSGS